MNIITSVALAVKNSPFLNQCSLILASENPFTRSTKEGHITASGLVIRDGRVLSIFHPHIKRWFQPGGHIDDGELPINAAIREVYEETGLVCVLDPKYPEAIDIDVHKIPANPEKGEGVHLHIDLLYCLKVLRQERPLENIACAWVPFEEIESIRIQRALTKLI